MAYTVINFTTKKALREAHAAGKVIEVYQPGGLFPLHDGSCTLEGPHYPRPHTWYAQCEVRGGRIVPGSKIR